jgi:hypothetical protein
MLTALNAVKWNITIILIELPMAIFLTIYM